jgi:hypothetical protein
MKSPVKISLSVMALAVLSACGGGGGGDSKPADVTAVAAATPSCFIDNKIFGAVGLTVPDAIKLTSANSLTCDQVIAQLKPLIDAAGKNITDLKAQLADAIAKRDAAVVASTANGAALAKAQTDLKAAQTSIATLTAQITAANDMFGQSQIALAKAKADLAAAQTALAANKDAAAVVDLTAKLATANASVTQLTARAVTAEKALADVNAQLTAVNADSATKITAANAQIADLQKQIAAAGNTAAQQAILDSAKILQAQAAADKAAADVASAQAAADVKAAQLLSVQAKAATDAAATSQAKSTADVQVAQAATAAALADLATAKAALATTQAALTAAQAANAGGNTTGLPLCSSLAAGTAPNIGTNCVTTPAEQVAAAQAAALAKAAADKAAADAAAAAAAQAAAVKYDCLYAATNGFVIAEPGGKTWILDFTTPDAVFGDVNVPKSTGNTIDITSKSLSYTHADVGVTGSYTKGQSSNLSLKYPGSTSALALTYDTAYDTTLVMPAGTFGGSDFYTGSTKVSFVISADGKTFTGAEDACTYSGSFTDTTKGYNKVAITFGNGCAVPAGTNGAGAVGKYGDNYVLFTNQAGQFADVAFVAFISATANAPMAVAKSQMARSVVH